MLCSIKFPNRYRHAQLRIVRNLTPVPTSRNGASRGRYHFRATARLPFFDAAQNISFQRLPKFISTKLSEETGWHCTSYGGYSGAKRCSRPTQPHGLKEHGCLADSGSPINHEKVDDTSENWRDQKLFCSVAAVRHTFTFDCFLRQ